MDNVMIFWGNLLEIILLVIFIGGPLALTGINLWNALAKKKFAPRVFAVLTLVIGQIFYWILLTGGFDLSGKDYAETIYRFQLHNIIDSAHLLSFVLPCLVGVAGLMVLLLCKPKYLPPLVSSSAIGAVLIGNIMNVLYAIQITKQVDEPVFLLLYLYHFNLLLLSVSGIRQHIQEQTVLIQERKTQFRYRWVEKLYKFLSKASHMGLFSFALVFPLAALLEIVLILCGQGADGIVKAFTMTADWTFSTQIPPPPLEYDGHYLCTVAAGGHKKVVRPLRFGTRLGHPIVVNRQLCIANAFEELIRERTPRMHRQVRHFYDTYGYPLSKIITTPFRADLTYVLMKPLEWLFLLVLYTFDANPEQRIAVQYPWKEEMTEK